ncbi:WASP homolog-associated protein with actin, membranes and microtubules-like isoform X2 [Myxocyprinus asiaticus]|uniref:WASP homolog-associated protein with actin, membranes and microtubules-like isoform X2 n=1 Tax=Myxocyprinus asiaticus TaxID=70543 RepID=UPI0022232DB4|nr:WASP homolog-associated protein with actin, membranes and microtubules-like isoform X2 [Myxocyprinus asiaticus]
MTSGNGGGSETQTYALNAMGDADIERVDSLDGWVAVKPDAFDESETHKLKFIVEWNEIETKFAVTCHNRTLQRRGDASGSCAGLFSGSHLTHVHAQLSAVRDELDPLFPDLTGFREPNLWELLFSSGPRSDADAPCRQLERYFSAAVDACGRGIVLDALFSVSDRDEEQYFEDMREFKRNAMRDQIQRAKDTLRALVQTHSSTDGLVRLMKLYEEEDEAYRELVSVATQFYQNLLQPFRDMRELATFYRTEIMKCLQYEDLGPKRVCELEAEMHEWNRRGETAVHSIQDATADYFKDTSKALTGMVKQMEEDRKRFGLSSWAMATPRQERLRFLLAKETLQYMRAKEMCIKRKKGDIREKMHGIAEGGAEGMAESVSTVSALELQYYEVQLELHDCKFEILKNEELLLQTQIQTIQRQLRELQEQVVYYDTCEDPEELQDVQVNASPAQKHLQQHLKQLERQRGAISSRRAQLRNQREMCVQAHELQQRSVAQRSEQHRQHHASQLKREKRRVDEEKRKQWVDREREKTLNRLRSFRERHQGQYVLKTAHVRPVLHDPSSDDSSQPLSIISLEPQSSTPCRKGRSLKQRDIPVQILLPAGGAAAKLEQTIPPPPPPVPPLPSVPPPPPPPPLPLHHTPPINEKLPIKKSLEQNAGSMDELLASLQRGQKQLRKVTVSTDSSNFRDSLMSAIRLGVTLKKVTPHTGPAHSSDSELERSIKAAMMRMKKISNDSDDEEGSDMPSGDWDS